MVRIGCQYTLFHTPLVAQREKSRMNLDRVPEAFRQVFAKQSLPGSGKTPPPQTADYALR
jgi:hypothetical protein